MSLNPSLEDVHHCPRCGREPEISYPRSIICPHCGYAAFYNPKPVAGVIPRDEQGRIWLLRRAFDPGKGLWTFPGGFVDLGESVRDAALRETREEMEIDVEIEALVGVYSRAEDRVVLIVFAGSTKGEPRTTEEATEVRPFAPDALPWDEMAFWSTTQALRDAL